MVENIHAHNHSHGGHDHLHENYDISNYEDMNPATCDVKEALIAKLQQLDIKIFQLIKSNKLIAEDLKDDPDSGNYIKENEDVLLNTKNEVYKIINAFIKSGIDVDKEVYGTLKHKNLYIGELSLVPKTEVVSEAMAQEQTQPLIVDSQQQEANDVEVYL